MQRHKVIIVFLKDTWWDPVRLNHIQALVNRIASSDAEKHLLSWLQRKWNASFTKTTPKYTQNISIHTGGEWTAIRLSVYTRLREQLLKRKNRLYMILPTVMKAETKAEFITNKGKEDNTNVKDVQNQK